MPSSTLPRQWLLLALFLLVLGAIIGGNLNAEYHRIDRQERERLLTQTQVIDKNLEYQLTATNHALDSIRLDLPAMRAEKNGQDALQSRLEAMRGAMPNTRAITLFDGEGTLFARSPNQFVGQNFKDREYFQAARQGGDKDKLYVAPPFLAKTGEYVLNMSKVLLDAEGSFAGVILVSLGPEYFDTLLKSVLYESDMRSTLIHGDGKIVYRVPDPQGITGVNVTSKPGSFLAEHLKSGQATNVFKGIGAASGETRLTVFRTIQPAAVPTDNPLVIAASREVSALFAPWHGSLLIHGSLFLLLALVTTLGLFLYQRQQLADARLLGEQEGKRLEAEKALHLTRFSVNAASDAIFWVTPEACIVDVNRAACRTLGYSREELLQLNIADIDTQFSPTFWPQHFAELRQRGSLTFESEHRTRAGQVFPVEIVANYVKFGDEERNCAFVRDITARKEAEEVHAQLTLRLNQAQKMEAIGVLAGGIAHDFNNILAAILGYTELARDNSPSGSPIGNHLEQVLTAAHRAKELVKQILAFSRQATVAKLSLQILPLVKESLKMLRASLPSTIAIIEELQPDCGTILADPTQIHQILMNLCTNAYHAMEQTGGKLTVRVAKITLATPPLTGAAGKLPPGEYIEIAIGDTGTGIGPDIIDRIFDPYFTTKAIGRGTGMGLSITHGIVKSHGGAITVESTTGQGSTFHLYLPTSPREESLAPTPSPIATPRGTGRILYVDDEEVLLEMGRELLQGLGYTVTARQSGFAALETFNRDPQQFDLVVTDQTMPGLTGSDLARHLLQIRPELPIILCTGYSNLVDESSAKTIGIREFALKPLTRSSIGQLVEKVLRS